jgi:hypothetical protein
LLKCLFLHVSGKKARPDPAGTHQHTENPEKWRMIPERHADVNLISKCCAGIVILRIDHLKKLML